MDDSYTHLGHVLPLSFYNTLNRRKEKFKPLVDGQVGMYVCGVTPYDHSHVGHARVYVVFDTLYRLLKAGGWKAKYVRNFTDIDDKIIARASEIGENPLNLSKRFMSSFHEDMKALNVLTPDHEPLVTTHIPEIIHMIQDLVAKGSAYVTASGDVMYRVSSFGGYGKLSGKNVKDLQAGARVDVNDEKEASADFALWKAAKPGEPNWESPWGNGRPGWHIECSAMSSKYLGKTFDIHAGGEDLQFPHHENEIAQSEACNGCAYVTTWLHNAFITVDGKKMSKSVGNFITIKDVLKDYHGEAMRLFILTTHYRKPVDFSDEALSAATTAIEKFYRGLYRSMHLEMDSANFNEEVLSEFYESLADDLNTPQALALMHQVLKSLNNNVDSGQNEHAARDRATLLHMGHVMGMLYQDPKAYLEGKPTSLSSGMSDDDIAKMIAERNEARNNKNFARSDEIRDELMAKGIMIEDGATGTSWRRG
ncbi:MAG: cysteine--tRNA ligase [Alphaproteobacteria bacterium]|nr:cysteine--tRNA ligase [Alphaproteobacteria bacterium]